MSKFYAQTVHSDILIHWTGRKFDGAVKETYHDNPNRELPSKTDPDLTESYLKRLFSILTYGIWVTEDENTDHIVVNNKQFDLPRHPRACFTELKLSESRKHAFKFGRLGIGFKRLFVVGRGGHPVHYLHNQGTSLFFPPHVKESELNESKYSFFKKMNSVQHDLNYDLFAESEWRIVYDPKLPSAKHFVNPRGNLKDEFDKYSYKKNLNFANFEAFCRNAQEDPCLRFFLPLDGWLAMIIYPSPDVKNIAKERGVHKLIENIKIDNPRPISPGYEQIMMPLELDLDLCDHF
jgi:hypothetical protein